MDTAVSYTHLRTVTDGYDFADHRGILLQRDVDHGAVQDCDALGFVAVSYTHLDVYKRQLHCCAAVLLFLFAISVRVKG